MLKRIFYVGQPSCSTGHCEGPFPKQSLPAATVIAKAKLEASLPYDYEIALLMLAMTETVLFGGQCPPYIEIIFNTKNMKKTGFRFAL
ncbi:MAG: hypothetical protein ACUBOA_08070 [Candidatus Loosdrechtia sp.]|uniref:hypothetical protein n=1 Tax=Candidatus Loosdrechtia sp. TaxID=3101272 RepID=UPI003A653A72|nr:MAG: hypothetical protein QY305_06405 [Candidatus Jettenia sp. AMX2]